MDGSGFSREGGGGGGAATAPEPDLSWMSFSPEAHGLKPALSVWPSRSNDDSNTSSPDVRQQEHKKKGFGTDDGGGSGSGRAAKGKSNGQSRFDEGEYEWIQEDIVKEEEEEEDGWQRRGRSRSRRRTRADRGKEQRRQVIEDFDDDDNGGGGRNGDGSSSVDDRGASLSPSSPAGGIRRPPSPSFALRSVGRGIQTRGRQHKSWMESLDEDTAAAQRPWSTDFPRRLQFAAVVTSFGCIVAFVISIILLYLSFGVTPRPPSSCEFEKVVLNFTAPRIRLRGGRYISFREQGVGADRAQHSLLVVHDLVSSRLAGIPGVSESLLKEFGVRLIAYDRPGYGQSDPHLGRSYNSSAQDMADIADALGVSEKFWVAGFGNGGPHVWAAINYIPERLAGVALFAPAGNFYAESMTKDEVSKTWGLLTLRQKWMYSMARLFPAFLPSLLQKTLVDQNPIPFRSMGRPTIESKDHVLMEKEEIVDFWERDLREALQQKCAFPVAEELILLVNNWGFSLAKLPFNEIEVKTLLQQFVGLFQSNEKPRIFSGPIHIWQGTDDQHVPATFNEYAKRMIQINGFSKSTDSQVNLHILEGEGHFSWFWFCDYCHRAIFNSLFQTGVVAGPFGRQVFSAEEYEAILTAFGGPKQRVEKMTKPEEAPVTFERNIEGVTDDIVYRNADSEDQTSTGIKLFVPESCDVPIDISAFILRAIDERIKKLIG